MSENQTTAATLESLKAAVATKGEGLARSEESDPQGLYTAWCEATAGGIGADTLYGLLPGDVVNLALAQIEASDEGKLDENLVELWEKATW